MKKLLITCILCCGLVAALTPASAQNAEAIGYVNAFIRVASTPDGGGTVTARLPNATTADLYRATRDYKGVLPVGEIVGAGVAYLQVNARPADGYQFVGWYVDDGDGVFDPDKDELDTYLAETTIFFAAADFNGGSDEYPATEAAAKAVALPEQPQAIVFAYFTEGAYVYNEYDMDDFGSVSISNRGNKPGDQVTITATPAPGYHFEYWKTVPGSQLLEQDKEKFVFSRDNPCTFTVQGQEHLYAYYVADDAPTLEFPAEGGWKAMGTSAAWIIHEQSHAYSYTFTLDEISRQQGRALFNTDKEDAIFDNTHIFSNNGTDWNAGTLLWGRGTVRLAYSLYGRLINDYTRGNALLRWCDERGTTITDNGNANAYHVYAFSEVRQAFIHIGTTDIMADPTATTSITIPGNTAYICLSAYDMMNIMDQQTRQMPQVIAFTAEGYDAAVTSIDEVLNSQTVNRKSLNGQLYDLQGRRIQNPVPGLYISNGKKLILK